MPDMNAKRFFPVIHSPISSLETEIEYAIRDTKIAMENGADGVFIVGHWGNTGNLCRAYKNVRDQFPEIWIGLNFRGMGELLSDFPKSVPRLVPVFEDEVEQYYKGNLNAIWFDYLPKARVNTPSTFEVFGGVNFDPEILGDESAVSWKKVMKVVDTITVSHKRCGEPFDLHTFMLNGRRNSVAVDPLRLEVIREKIGDSPRIALACEIDRNNIEPYWMCNDFMITPKMKDVDGEGLGPFCDKDVLLLAEAIHRL